MTVPEPDEVDTTDEDENSNTIDTADTPEEKPETKPETNTAQQMADFFSNLFGKLL